MAIEVKQTSREFNEVEQYLMTISPAIISMKDVADGDKIVVAGYMMFDDNKENGDSSEIMSIITDEQQVYSCQSATFKRSILDIADIMHGKPFTVIKTSGVTKAGRDYINCTLDIASVKM